MKLAVGLVLFSWFLLSGVYAEDGSSVPMAAQREDALDELPFYYFTGVSGEENWYEKEIGIDGRNKILAEQKRRKRRGKRSAKYARKLKKQKRATTSTQRRKVNTKRKIKRSVSEDKKTKKSIKEELEKEIEDSEGWVEVN